MKKMILLLALIIMCLGCASGPSSKKEQSLFISAKGNNNNNGLSERKALKTLAFAYKKAASEKIKKITVIGTLNQQSEGSETNDFLFMTFGSMFSSEEIRSLSYVFFLNTDNFIEGEILITGKLGASYKDRAVLSGADSKKSVVYIK